MAMVDGSVRSGDLVVSALSASSHTFLQPAPALHLDAVAFAKNLLDPLAADVAEAQSARREENRKKRKRGIIEPEDAVLQLRQVYTSGLGVQQVWEQARRVLDAACAEVERNVAAHQDQRAVVSPSVDGHEDAYDTAGESDESHMEDGEEEDGEDRLTEQDPEIQNNEGAYHGEGFEDEDTAEEEDDDDDEIESDVDQQTVEETFVQDPHGLNDGFFSIDDFNRQTQFLEQQDARGEDDNPSDEDEIDWDADPLLTIPLAKAKRPLADESNDHENIDGDLEDSGDDEEGPTFDEADLDADETDEDAAKSPDNDVLDDAVFGLANTNDIRYANFFEPPPKKASKTKRMRALPKTQPPAQGPRESGDDWESDIQRAVADVRRDLLDSDEESSEIESGSDMDEGQGPAAMKNMSTHEKQRAAIAAEIRRLEAANVAKKDWTLSGEARAAERPINSLIEEDLEFERVGKPVPVITAEVSEEIEQLIKRRIIARDFDEVVRRRPDAIGNAADTRRGRVEVDDTKPQAGLAEIYEQEHLKSTDPGYVDKRSAATKKQHDEISRLWKEVSSQLDLLSNLHFKPKRIEVEIKTVEDKPVISMEDARPVGAGGQESMLAPQEIYRPGETGPTNGEVVRKSGASVSKEEMSREEKVRRRRREKERMKKARGNKTRSAQRDASNIGKSDGQGKRDLLDELRKGNVKVIDSKGQLQELGKQKRGHAEGQSSSGLKL